MYVDIQSKYGHLNIYILSDDLRRTAGRSWMRVAEDRARWRVIGEAYVQQWTVIG
jgi:hypothetical protein